MVWVSSVVPQTHLLARSYFPGGQQSSWERRLLTQHVPGLINAPPLRRYALPAVHPSLLGGTCVSTRRKMTP
ncbi:hypothetical protein E2C01_068146 [Portunus trituberculatus]|uniref:Uncharacterized protein n=1 Tax=Portunus trituberculatus TaxID=210409 RepID=A0A5B7HYP2_PORTR|nr:hypothetical protein [Portunus trituberculatus]